jgi:hypothetical protein
MLLTALRVANLLVWGALFAYMVPAARHAVTGKDVRRADPMRLSVAAVCIVMILGNLRWLIAPENMNMLGAVSVLSLLVGIYKIILARTYGRGPRL